MIHKTEYFSTLAPFGKTVFGCRILAAASAYGLAEPFAQFWAQGSSAAICKLDDTVILAADEAADFGELAEFIRMTGAARLLCSGEAADHLDFPVSVRGEIMAFQNVNQHPLPPGAEVNPGVREIHALLCACETPHFQAPEFEPFYLDLSHRVRHGAALAVGIRRNGEMAACAVCTAKTEGLAVVSAVAVKPELRHKGLGHAVLGALLSQLPQKSVFIFRAQGENEAFYRSFGFLPAGTFAECNL